MTDNGSNKMTIDIAQAGSRTAEPAGTTTQPDVTLRAKTTGLGKRLSAVLASAAISLAGLGLVAPAAHADTKSCTFYAGGVVSGQYVPSNTYCVNRVGSGRWVSGVQGEWYGAKLCNYEVTAEFFNSNWQYRGWTRVTPRNYGCAYGSTWMPYIGINNSMAGLTGTGTGYLCSTLRVGGQRVSSSCQYIY